MSERSLHERLDSFAEAWKPVPGDKLVGPIVDLDERVSQYAEDAYPIVTVLSDDTGEEVAFHAFHTVARNELAKQKPQIGDRIGIAYHGKLEGKSYERYRIIVVRAQGEPKTIDWARHVQTDGEAEKDAAGDETPKPPGDDIPY